MCTSHEDKENHGYGMENIKKAVEKYDGEMKFEYVGKIFKTYILMYEKVST